MSASKNINENVGFSKGVTFWQSCGVTVANKNTLVP